MKWLKNLWRSSSKRATAGIGSVSLALAGWTEERAPNEIRAWHNIDGDILTLAHLQEVLPNFEEADEVKVRKWSRDLAQSRGAGLVEAHKLEHSFNLVYKRLVRPAYIYTGMLLTLVRGSWLVWTIVAGERGTTGIREAVVTATLISERKLKPEEYELRWAQDPYEPGYRSVERAVLRSISDDESYDDQFPLHPLSKVRHTLALLPSSVKYDLFVPFSA
jgi:hypothetical protein